MLPALSALSFLTVAGVTISPPTVPAKGHQEAIVHLDQAGMVHLAAETSYGTACVLVDHLRGPFASSGQVGKSSCRLDLLLDAGDYQLRLDSPKRAKGTVKLTAAPFEELNRPLVRLDPQRTVELALHSGQQASFWLSIQHGGPVDLRILGRTAGQVELWRSGEWVEASGLSDSLRQVTPSVQVHDWHGQPNLEAGTYLLVVYGANAAPATTTPALDQVQVSYGFPATPPQPFVTLTLPPLGITSLRLPSGARVVGLRRLAPADDSIRLDLGDLDPIHEVVSSGSAGSCEVQPKSNVSSCAAFARAEAPHVAWVSGPPGSRVALTWGAFTNRELSDGYFGDARSSFSFTAPATGDFYVATQDLQNDSDSAPQGCLLEEQPERAPLNPVAFDFLPISDTQPLSRQFNYDGSSETIGFEVTSTQAYRVATSGGRGSSCELFQFEGAERKRVAGADPGATTCNLKPLLGAGRYELRLFGGNAGIEKLVITKGRSDPAQTAGKTSCRFGKVSLSSNTRYQVELTRNGESPARGLVLRSLPLDLFQPLPLHLDPGDLVELPVATPDAISVTSGPEAHFSCSRGAQVGVVAGGSCQLPTAGLPGALVVKNTGSTPLDLVAMIPQPPPAPPPLTVFSPQLEVLPEIQEGTPRSFDFDRLGSHSVLFTVKEAGLYDVATEGLLSTSCFIRTPIVANVAQDTSGGRGRNCLVAQYLREGRYLLTVSTTGQSRGRAAIRVSERKVRDADSMSTGSESFVKVGASELVKQRLTVHQGGTFNLSTTTLNGPLQCRLEDSRGWPLVEAPTACTGYRPLAAGSYVWLQLPLTVPGRRHTVFRRVVPELPLTGAKAHQVAINTSYDVRLSKKGQDTFHFTTEADLDVYFALSNAMEGRLASVGADGKTSPVEFIAPQTQETPPTPPPDDSSGEGGDQGDMGDANAPRPMPSAGDDGDSPPPDSPDDAPPPDDSAQPAVAATPVAPPATRPQAPTGFMVHLPAGRYELVTRHSRGDAGISYRLTVSTDALAPGISRIVNAPARLPLRLARDGILRLLTSGETDVRCRVFDSEGRLLHESSDNGDDWNCALAEPFRAGEYEVVIESETQVPGVTTVSVSMPRAGDQTALVDGAKLKVGNTAASATLPAATGDEVQEVMLRSKSRFSCALTSADGSVLHHETGVTVCGFLVRPGPQPLRVDLWTLNRSAEIAASVRTRPISAQSGGTMSAGTAVRATIPHAGRYETSTGVLCLPDSKRGVLQPCGPEVSLEGGPVVFGLLGAAEAKLPLDEVVDQLGAPQTSPLALERAPYLERLQVGQTIQLVALRTSLAEKASPICQIEGGASVLTDHACFAAGGSSGTGLLRARSSSEDALAATFERRSIRYPSDSTPLALGRSTLTLGADPVRLAAPSGPWEAWLVLGAHSWAVVVDEKGAAVDLCAPADQLSPCALEGVGGSVVVLSPEEPRLELTAMALDAMPTERALSALFEQRAGFPGSERLRIQPGEGERLVEAEGADHCQLRLDDGTRTESCLGHVPPHQGGRFTVDHGAQGIRATLYAANAEAARFGSLSPYASGAALASATQVSLSGDHLERTVTLDHDAVVHLTSTGGVCGLARGNQLIAESGLGAGCDLFRLAPAGTYRLIVRRFADAPLSGEAHWTAEPVEELTDGMGTERWLSPGQRRFFRFTTASAGQVGLGIHAPTDALDCSLYSADQTKLGDGCQQFLALPAGSYVVSVHAPEHGAALRFQPVVLGLTGATMDVPEDYLRDLFSRIGSQP